MKTVNDHELVMLLKDGCHEAYAEIYRRHYALLFSHAYKRLGDKELAKDLIQELFTNTWEKRELFVLKSSLAGYFFTTINNRIVNHFLHEGVKEKYASAFSSFASKEETRSDHRIREKQLAELIEKEIQQLPPKMRQIFEMSRKEHLSHKEIAERLELNEKTVDRQVSNALLRLKAKFLLSLIIYFLFET
ncbi:RNA polymerase ECF-type sigma factor [Pedobacter sp. BAL39]|uniref:RNA polymerase sigma factor n=1 Tax=Pedobacter sp. BAL39 TaxID=391596 RepID=UPI000155965A|nr:RNA polymerase sigma-70 factor [Pedobacter sp. BAL39]EDM36095.1 RNA polymerase ECF-type sigma factor [Pedobacter sp. BAL39]